MLLKSQKEISAQQIFEDAIQGLKLSIPSLGKRLEKRLCLRTIPNGKGSWHTNVRFSGKEEYEPPRGRGIVAKSVFMNEPERITKEEYYKF